VAGETRPRTLSLFPEDRCDGLLADASIVRVRLAELRLSRPRQWGACPADVDAVSGAGAVLGQRLGVSRESLPSRKRGCAGAISVCAGGLSPVGAGQRMAPAS
jgi:hypothetical protein